MNFGGRKPGGAREGNGWHHVIIQYVSVCLLSLVGELTGEPALQTEQMREWCLESDTVNPIAERASDGNLEMEGAVVFFAGNRRPKPGAHLPRALPMEEL